MFVIYVKGKKTELSADMCTYCAPILLAARKWGMDVKMGVLCCALL